jgi:hypothetical protein
MIVPFTINSSKPKKVNRIPGNILVLTQSGQEDRDRD